LFLGVGGDFVWHRLVLLSEVLVSKLASFPAGLHADPAIDRVQDVGGIWVSGYLPFAIGCNRPEADVYGSSNQLEADHRHIPNEFVTSKQVLSFFLVCPCQFLAKNSGDSRDYVWTRNVMHQMTIKEAW